MLQDLSYLLYLLPLIALYRGLIYLLLLMDAHIESVARIAASIRRFDEAKTPWRVYHGGSNSTRPPPPLLPARPHPARGPAPGGRPPPPPGW